MDIGFETAFVDVGHTLSIRIKASIEKRSLQHACDVLIATRHKDVMKVSFRMPPASRMRRGRPRLQIGHQVHLAFCHLAPLLPRLSGLSRDALFGQRRPIASATGKPNHSTWTW